MVTTVAAAALTPVAAIAHHSPAQYDLTREVELEGTVKTLDWKNPHILMTLEMRGAAGEPVLQEIEVAAVSQVRVLGLPRQAIAPGEQVVVRAAQSRRGPGAKALGLTVTTDDGAVYSLMSVHPVLSVRPAATTQARGLEGHWVPTVDSFNIYSVAQSWPFTEAGSAAYAEMRTRVQSGATGFCEPFTVFNLAVIPDPISIEVDETSVVLVYEAEGMNQRRVVHLDQAQHPAIAEPSLLGHSIGRWEGEALVIDTVAIAHPRGVFVLPATASTRVVERLALTADRRQIEYTITIEDPAHLTSPGSFMARWDHRPDLEPSAEPCDPDNARRAAGE
jgi:hypothetical protein